MTIPAPQLANILAITKSYLDVASTSQDAILTVLINAEFSAIEKYCERKFLVADYIERFVGAGELAYFPKNDNIRSVASFVANNSDIKIAFTDDYSIRFDNPLPRVNCVLTYSAGLDLIPDDIIGVICEAASIRYRERERIGMASKGMAGETTSFRASRWSPENLKTINCYKRGF